MCGICGIWNYRDGEPVDTQLLGRMRDTLVHRGPDDAGQYRSARGDLGLWFRRLSIIDLSPAGHQPMCNEDGSVWVVFNGEIYNFQALRTRLEARGHQFRSRTDTEVIVHLYEEKGVDFVRDLNGMFALAIWDDRRRQLLLARDRLGKKPLYYFDDGRRLVFGSEAKALLADRSVPREIDWEGLGQFLALGYVAAPRSAFAGLRKLPPASVATFRDGTRAVQQYWDWLPAFRQPKRHLSMDEWSDQILETLDETVKCRMTSDVPIGAFLSGGIDSSAVVASMARCSDRPVRTFSIGFAQYRNSELEAARTIAERHGTEHEEFVVQPDAVRDLLPALVRQYDEPFADSSAVPTYYVSRLARRHVTVCLSGDGGDEACGGYDRYAQAMREQAVDRIPLSLRRWFLAPAALLPFGTPGRRRVQRFRRDAASRYISAVTHMPHEQMRTLLTPDALGRIGTAGPAPVRDALASCGDLPLLSRLQYTDARTYLPEDILVKVDRASMMSSLEVRSPLLDVRFLELMATAPPELLLQNGVGKRLLRHALRRRLPPEILDRPKMGFGVPTEAWFRGDITAFAQEVLLDRRTSERGIFSPGALARAIRTQERGFFQRGSVLWVALMCELWARAFLDVNYA